MAERVPGSGTLVRTLEQRPKRGKMLVECAGIGGA